MSLHPAASKSAARSGPIFTHDACTPQRVRGLAADAPHIGNTESALAGDILIRAGGQHDAKGGKPARAWMLDM